MVIQGEFNYRGFNFSENAFETRNFFLSLIVGIIKEASIDEFREDATIVSLEG